MIIKGNYINMNLHEAQLIIHRNTEHQKFLYKQFPENRVKFGLTKEEETKRITSRYKISQFIHCYNSLTVKIFSPFLFLHIRTLPNTLNSYKRLASYSLTNPTP